MAINNLQVNRTQIIGPLPTLFSPKTLDDPRAVARIDLAEIIGRIVRNGISAIRALSHFGTNGHAARLAGLLVGVFPLHRGWSKTHDDRLSYLALSNIS